MLGNYLAEINHHQGLYAHLQAALDAHSAASAANAPGAKAGDAQLTARTPVGQHAV
jgi:Xaa-Pro aminopeptidase